MSEKKRKKKDGHDKNKELQAMRDVERHRHPDIPANADSTDEGDHVTYKPGSASDRSQVGAR